ncbi:unnamed protein product [Withania somnifera]
MDARTGEILWTTAVPNRGRSNPLTVANGVVLAGSQNPRGPIYTIDTKTGKLLCNGCFYVGHGYRSGTGVFNPNTAGTSLFAYCVC